MINKYLEKIEKLDEEDYFVSSKVLLAAALLLRIKSEILLNQYIKSIDEILFGKKETVKKIEMIEFDEEIPELIPRSPFPRLKKVTLNELVESLNKAIVTEGRRIKKEIVKKDSLREISISLPKKKYAVNDKIKDKYISLVSKRGDVPIFLQPWWLDAVVEKNTWDVVFIGEEGLLKACFVYVLKKKGPFI